MSFERVGATPYCPPGFKLNTPATQVGWQACPQGTSGHYEATIADWTPGYVDERLCTHEAGCKAWRKKGHELCARHFGLLNAQSDAAVSDPAEVSD